MSNSTREKIALLIFAILIVFSLCAFVAYFLAGHSFNVAATTIDDVTGNLDGYTVVVYQGTSKQNELDETLPEQSLLERFEENVAKPSQKASHVKARFVVDDYLEKGADALLLDSLDPADYEEGLILRRGGHRFGVLGIDAETKAKEVAACLKYFKESDVDYVVVVAQSKAVFDRFDKATGVDIVVCSTDENLFDMGETHNGVFFVDTPAKGEVGVVIASPSGVLSAKVVSDS